jgi:DNA-directed RNA polymerase specialized sigma24 family protein
MSLSDVTAESATPFWSVIRGVQQNDGEAITGLRDAFHSGVTWMLRRQTGVQNVEDSVQECFAQTVDYIQRRGLDDPDRLPGLVMTMATSLVATRIAEATERRNKQQEIPDSGFLVDCGPSPEATILRSETVGAARKILDSLKPVERELLCRFYVRQESKDEICSALTLSEEQFNNVKNRARSRFAALRHTQVQPLGKPVVSHLKSRSKAA